MNLNKVKIISIALILLTFYVLIVDVNAYTKVSKDKLIYEINSATLDETGISISGWSFIGESQHFSDTKDFYGALLLDNGNEILEFPLSFYRKDMTDLMKMGNPRRCGDNEYNQNARTCYYDYSNVGWSVFIPLESLSDDSIYNISLNIKTYKSNQNFVTRVVFATDLQIITDEERDRVISLNAAINNTRLLINHDYVMVRKNPYKDSNVYYSDKSCSLEYGKVQYFIKSTEYLRVKGYRSIDDVTWYQVGTQEIGCYNSLASVIEGDTLAWIPSTYVSYNGSMATINVKNIYEEPIIYLENQTIYVGDTSFNPDLYVTAYDKHDGQIVPIRVRTNLDINKVGRYMVMYRATNSKNLSVLDIMYVDVIEKNTNLPPIIEAYDQIIYVNDIYDPMKNATAYDKEEEDITNKIQLTTTVTSSKQGNYEQCYYVEDSLGLSDNKCVQITVLPNVIDPIYQTNSIRFVDINKPFYQESIPSIWINLKNTLLNNIKATKTIKSGYY